MTYYEEDTPELSVEKEDPHPEDKEILEALAEAAKQPQPILAIDKAADRHQEMMEMLGGIFIQMSRVYDAVMISLDEDDRKFVESYHSRGKLLGDPPILEEDAWS